MALNRAFVALGRTTEGLSRSFWNRGALSRCASTSGKLLNAEKVTHTGQKWEESDYRQVRFTDREKLVNKQFAIDLVAEEPVVVIKGTHTWCDGGKGALGHPKVYINLDKPEIISCPYCGKRFVAEAFMELFKGEKFVYEDED